jgi:hypothetical protein
MSRYARRRGEGGSTQVQARSKYGGKFHPSSTTRTMDNNADCFDPVSLGTGNVGEQREEVEAGEARGSNVAHSLSHGGNLLGVAPVWNGVIYIYYYYFKNV